MTFTAVTIKLKCVYDIIYDGCSYSNTLYTYMQLKYYSFKQQIIDLNRFLICSSLRRTIAIIGNDYLTPRNKLYIRNLTGPSNILFKKGFRFVE